MKKYTIHFSDGSTQIATETTIIKALVDATIGTGKFMSDVIAITLNDMVSGINIIN